MNYIEEQTDGELLTRSITHGEQPLSVISQVSLDGTTPNVPPVRKRSLYTFEEKRIRKIDRLARSLFIQGIQNDIYSLIDNNDTTKELWDALNRQMRGFEFGEQDRKSIKCGFKKDNCELNYKFLNNLLPDWKQYGTLMRQTKNLMDINIDALYNILKKNQVECERSSGYKEERSCCYCFRSVLVIKKTKVSKSKEKEVVDSDSEESDDEDINDLKMIIALLAKKPQYVKQVDKKNDGKKKDISKVTCYNYKKDGHFAKDCRKAKMQMTDSDSEEELSTNMVCMAKMKKVLSDSEKSSSFDRDTIAEVSYYFSDSESEYEFDDTSDYYDKSKLNYGLFVDNDDDQEIFHDAIELASENFDENLLVSKNDHDKLEIDHNESEDKYHLVDKLVVKFTQKIAKCQKSKDLRPSLYDEKVIGLGLSRFAWILNSRCSKHMTGNHALLKNFMDKFLGTVRFDNDDFAVIAGYGDLVLGSMTIKKVYYVECLGHNLFSVGQFCDKGLEVAFRKSTCFVRTEEGVDLLTGDHSSNLYTISLNNMASNSLVCPLVSILVVASIMSNTAFASNRPLYLLHIDLCGPIHVESINGKRYVLVVVDDYSRHTWNKTLVEFFDKVGITQQFSAARMPQQNGVVERRNCTLVEATFALVARIKAIRLLRAYAASKDFIVFQMDVKTVFLNGILKVEVYVSQPQGFVSTKYPNHVYALHKVVYGLKQAPRVWLQVNQFSNGIFINQSKYINDISKRFGMENCDMVPNPMVEQAKLNLDLVGKPVDQFRSMIGSMMYLTSGRPHIMFATCMCARYQANPNEHHVSAKRIFKYLKGTINLGLSYPKDSGFDLTTYSDVDHAGCHLDRKSTSRSVQFLGDKLVCWSLKKQNCVFISLAEAEYVVICGCCAQVLWMRTQLTDYGFFFDKIPIYCDSKSAIAISVQSGTTHSH
ncbi:retrovirus-related pol polyprotein from transposon TNT 1-94 [Tanacetum coccineum]